MNVFCRDSRLLAHRLHLSLSWLLILQLLAQAVWPALLPPAVAAAPPPPPPPSEVARPAPAVEPWLPGPAPLTSPALLTETLFLPLLLSEGGQAAAAAEPSAGPTRLYLPLLSKPERSGLDFTADPLSGPTPLLVTFSPTAAGPAQTLTWELGDGAVLTRTGATVFSHTYRYAGSYDVVLRSDGPEGQQVITRTNYIHADLGPSGVISEAGGTVTYPDGTIILDFAPGAVTQTLDIYIDPQELLPVRHSSDGVRLEENVPNGLPFKTFDLTARRSDGTTLSGLTFQAPVTLTAVYTDAQIATLWDETLSLVYYNPERTALDLIPSQVIPEKLQVTGVISHFSNYGIAGESALWQTPTLEAFDVALAKGQASFGYELPLPVGPTGFKPQVSLQYSTASVSSLYGEVSPDTNWVGTGWTLELGQIVESNAGRNDDNNSITSYNLTLNGTSETLKQDAKDPTLFRTEHETYMQIRRLEPANAPDRWQVIDSGGITYIFGEEGNLGSTLEYRDPVGKPSYNMCRTMQHTYKLYKIIDPHGNTLEIEYDRLPGHNRCAREQRDDGSWRYIPGSYPQSYPKFIRYTTNPRAGDSHAEYQVEFVTADKGYQADWHTQGDLTKKLTNIKVWYVPENGAPQLIRRLQFDQQTEITRIRTDRVHQLQGLQLFGADDVTSLPAMVFSYVPQPVSTYWIDRDNPEEWKAKMVTQMRPFLNTVENGYGATLDFNYRPGPNTLFPVVETKSVADSVTGLTSNYRYQFEQPNIVQDTNNWLDIDVRKVGFINFGRFYGFGQATVINPKGYKTISKFDTSYEKDYRLHDGPGLLNGRSLGTWVYDDQGHLYSASIPTWQAKLLLDRPLYRYDRKMIHDRVFFIYQEHQRDYLCDGASSSLAGCVQQQHLQSNYDLATGHLKEQKSFDASDRVHRQIVYEYTPAAGPFITGLPQLEQVLAGNGSRVAETRYQYDNHEFGAAPSLGLLTRQRVWAGESQYVDTVFSDHDQYGNARQAKTYEGYNGTGAERIARTVFDHQGLLPNKLYNALNHHSETRYDYRFQLPLAETDANGATTAYSYDPLGRLKQVLLPACTDGQAVFKAAYLDSANYRETIQQRTDECQGSPTYVTSHVFYDGLGRQIQAHSPGDTAGSYLVSSVAFDELGQQVKQSLPEARRDGFGSRQSVDWGRPHTTTQYDPLGRVTHLIEPNGSTTRTFYQGFKTAVIDANGHLKISEVDAFGRLAVIKEFAGTHTGPAWSGAAYATTRYSYDVLDHLTGVTDAQGHQIRLSYDALGQKTFMADPDMGEWHYRYDAAGRLISQIDAKRQAANLYYDRLDRLTGKLYEVGPVNPGSYTRPADPGPAGYAIAFTYDQTDAHHGAGLGRRTGMRDQAGTVDWRYDRQGRLLAESRRFTGRYDALQNNRSGDGAYVTAYSYDAADRMRTMTYPDGEVVTTSYTGRSLPDRLSTSLGGNYITRASYDALANLTEREAGSGLLTGYDYHGPGGNHRLQRIRIGNLLDLEYSQYDRLGNILQIIDHSAGEQTLAFSYDALDRLESARTTGGNIPGYDQLFTYDPVGNLTSAGGRSYVYSGPQPHAVTAVGNDAYQYDANGNMVRRFEGGVTYQQSWTIDNMLETIRWSPPGQTEHVTRFLYDGDGNRLAKFERSPAGAGQPVLELTTIYIGRHYEEQFETTADNLSQASAAGWAIQPQPVAQTAPALQPIRAAGLASPLPLPPAQSGCKQPGQPLDPWANCVVAYDINGDSDGTLPTNVLGNNFNTYYNLGRGDTNPSWLIVDMGSEEEAICDRAGNDLRIYEKQLSVYDSREWVSVAVSTRPDGGWIRVFGGNEITSLATPYQDINVPANAAGYRYVKLTSHSPKDNGSKGADIVAVEALHMCAAAIQTPIIRTPSEQSLQPTNNVVFGGHAGANVTVSLYEGQSLLAQTTSSSDGSWQTTAGPLGEGPHSITAQASRQRNGLTETSAPTGLSFRVDTQPPLVSISQPANNNAWFNSPSVTLAGTVQDAGSSVTGARYEVRADGQVIHSGPVYPTAGGAWQALVSLPNQPGAYAFSLYATDELNRSGTASRLFSLDPVAPQVTPATAQDQNTRSPLLAWRGSDNLTVAADLTFSVQHWTGSHWQDWLVRQPQTQATYPVSQDGVYVFQVKAHDQAGNESGWQSFSLSVDTVPPHLTLNHPQREGLIVVRSPITVTGSRGESGVTVTVNGQAAGPRPGTPTLYEAGVVLSPGPNPLIVSATDRAGNRTTLTRSVSYDPVGPQVSAAQPTGLVATARPVLSAVFSDGDSPNLTQARVRLDGLDLAGSVAPDLSGFSYPPPAALSEGEHTVSVFLEDAGGQVAAHSWSFTIDTRTEVSLVRPVDGQGVNRSPIEVEARAEAGAGVELAVNGQGVGQAIAGDGRISFANVSLKPGQNSLSLSAVDGLGNRAQTTAAITYDPGQAAAAIRTVPDRFNPMRQATTFDLEASAPAGDSVATWRVTITRDGQAVWVETTTVAPGSKASLWDSFEWDGQDRNGEVVADGDYTYELVVTTARGLSATASGGRVTVDSQAPAAPVITRPANNHSQREVTLRVEGTAEPGSAIVLSSAAFTATTQVAADGRWAVVLPLESGRNVLRATATDQAGLVSPPSAPLTVYATVRPPLYTVGLAPDAVAPGTRLDLTAAARGDDSAEGLPTVQVTAKLPGGGSVNLTKQGSQPLTTTWSLAWTVPATASDGLHEVGFSGTDAGGLTGDGSSALLIDGVAPPTPLLLSPSGESWRGDTAVPVSGRADPLDTVRLYASETLIATLTADAHGRWTGTASLPAGSHLIRAKAFDGVGNESGFSNSALVKVDLTAPTVTLDPPVASGRSVRLAWQADDGDGSGVAGYTVQVSQDQATWTAWLSATTQTSASFTALPQHQYWFRVKAVDVVGNESDWSEAVGPVETVTVTKYYAFGGSQVAMRQGERLYYFQGDHLGSTSLTTDSAGQLVSERRYQPYGQERWSSGATPTDFGFTGQRHEASFGLLDYNARYYSPVLGRFISPDSIVPEPGSAGGFNRYAYTYNNPLKYVDPSGHYGEEVHFDETKRIGDQVTKNFKALGIDVADDLSEVIATADVGVDKNSATSPANPLNTYPRIRLPFAKSWIEYGQKLDGVRPTQYYHFASREDTEARLQWAIDQGDVEAFGRALHSYQDSYSHAGYSLKRGLPGVVELAYTCSECFDEDFAGSFARSYFNVGHWPFAPNAPDKFDDTTPRDATMLKGTEYWLTLYMLHEAGTDPDQYYQDKEGMSHEKWYEQNVPR